MDALTVINRRQEENQLAIELFPLGPNKCTNAYFPRVHGVPHRGTPI